MLDQIPIDRGHDDARAKMLLEILRAAGMVLVSVTDADILDGCGIETQFLEPVYDLVFDRIIVDGIDDDDSIRRRDGPCRILRLPNPIKIVEDFYRFGVP